MFAIFKFLFYIYELPKHMWGISHYLALWGIIKHSRTTPNTSWADFTITIYSMVPRTDS